MLRVVVRRAEVDLGSIKDAYKAKYGEDLDDVLAKDKSDFGKTVAALAREA